MDSTLADTFKGIVEEKADHDAYWRSQGRRWRKRDDDPTWTEVQNLLLTRWDCTLADLPEQVVIIEVQPWKGLLQCHAADDEERRMLWQIGIFDLFYEPDPASSWERIVAV